ncbi:MAG: hypothetical protein KY439_03715 [Actinobacteria bacterium]|nr:hypothetical protein [Actinomycetota bacterium]
MVELGERLERYEVTSLPRRPALRLLWSPAGAGEDDEAVPSEPPPPLAILVAYRITRVPVRAAS